MLNGWVNYLFGATNDEQENKCNNINDRNEQASDDDWILVRGNGNCRNVLSKSHTPPSPLTSGRSSPLLVPDVLLESMNGSVTSEEEEVHENVTIAAVEENHKVPVAATSFIAAPKGGKGPHRRQLVQHYMFSERESVVTASRLSGASASQLTARTANDAAGRLKRANNVVHVANHATNRKGKMKSGCVSGANNDRKCQKNF